MMINTDREELASQLRGSLLEFTRYFYKYLTGREFIISKPNSRESHHITICRAYTKLFWEQKDSHGLLIAVPPGYGKSVMSCMWIAWCFTHYDDCNFLYISYSHDLAARHTSFVKQIMNSPLYKYLFDVQIKQDTRAKDKFETLGGGTVNAFGSGGAITGTNAGLQGQNRFSGCVLIDDAHKPDDVYSDSMRQAIIRNYQETILQRPRDVRVPIVFIGQRLHQEDLGSHLLSGQDVRKWETVILKGIDEAGNCLYPEVQPLKYLLDLQEKQPQVFSAQIQQEPLPAGGSIFKPEWFEILDKEPEMLATFLTCDTAETDKSYNDATVFSFWGVYEIESMGRKTSQIGLHWLDCLELRIEPKDLKTAFLDFYGNCSLHLKPPLMAAIEKKSTGVTLISILKELRGMTIREIERTKTSGSKTQRFLESQPYVSSRLVSFTKNSKHIESCIDHMTKITLNGAHRWDDRADTLADAVRIALIEKTLYNLDNKLEESKKEIMSGMQEAVRQKLKLGMIRYGNRQGPFR
jgi:predicted phage terminase large subunit-like protein